MIQIAYIIFFYIEGDKTIWMFYGKIFWWGRQLTVHIV